MESDEGVDGTEEVEGADGEEAEDEEAEGEEAEDDGAKDDGAGDNKYSKLFVSLGGIVIVFFFILSGFRYFDLVPSMVSVWIFPGL